MARPNLSLSVRTQQRLAMMGRLRMAEWIEMPESEFSREVEEIEKDSLFRKLFFASPGGQSVIRRQRWPAGRLSSGFYEINESVLARGERPDVEGRLEARAAVIPKIKQMGAAAFERYFVHGEESLPLEEIGRRTGLSLEDVSAIHLLLLEIGTEAEFYLPGREPDLVRGYTCLARLSLEGGEPRFEFFAPYWARGQYQIRYDLLEDVKKGESLEAGERKRLRHFLRRLETINLRQNTIYRILESLARLQAEFLRTRRDELKRPISLRILAHRLQLSPSTVSRAISGRSVKLPWGKEAPICVLLPGQRRVLRSVLGRWLDAGAAGTDSALSERLRSEYGIRVSRRTVNAVRNELKAAV